MTILNSLAFSQIHFFRRNKPPIESRGSRVESQFRTIKSAVLTGSRVQHPKAPPCRAEVGRRRAVPVQGSEFKVRRSMFAAPRSDFSISAFAFAIWYRSKKMVRVTVRVVPQKSPMFMRFGTLVRVQPPVGTPAPFEVQGSGAQGSTFTPSVVKASQSSQAWSRQVKASKAS